MQEDKPPLYKLALELSLLNIRDKKKLLKTIFDNTPEKQRSILIEYLFRVSFNQKYTQINRRLEKIFTRNINTKPFIAARMVKFYLRISETMMPLLIKLAQKAKDRVRKRIQKSDSIQHKTSANLR